MDTDGCSSRVLVVDDDEDIREALQMALEDAGYAVYGAANGVEALTLARQAPRPAVILLDLMMPVMDGWQFCVEHHRDPALCAIPLVVLSATSDRDVRNRGVHVADYLRKPVDIDSLLHTIARNAR